MARAFRATVVTPVVSVPILGRFQSQRVGQNVNRRRTPDPERLCAGVNYPGG